jgi:monoamine oxidase
VGEAFIHQLTQLFGPDAMSPRMVSVFDWSRERYTSPSFPSPEATAFTYGAAEFQSALAGRIYWASTETAVVNAGHIEGAILAGLRVATQLTDNRDH